jgi:hypothetical protein
MAPKRAPEWDHAKFRVFNPLKPYTLRFRAEAKDRQNIEKGPCLGAECESWAQGIHMATWVRLAGVVSP